MREHKELPYIVRRAGREIVNRIYIRVTVSGAARVWVDWINGDTTYVEFASAVVLFDWLNSRRNLLGVEVYDEPTSKFIGYVGNLLIWDHYDYDY
jgi:hypothetical protein